MNLALTLALAILAAAAPESATGPATAAIVHAVFVRGGAEAAARDAAIASVAHTAWEAFVPPR